MILSDCCLKIGSGATPRGGKSSYLEEGPFSLIRSQNIHNNLFARAGLAFISDEQAKQLQNVEVQPNDVLLNITGDSVARVCQVPEDVLPARVNQHVAIIRPDSSKLIHKYLHYFLVNPKMQTYMLNLASAGATRNALTKGMIESFEVPATSIDEQKAIASVLGALDDKIENNRRMNETLEEMARAIFKSWFVDFDPVHAKAAGDAPAHMDADTAALFPSSFGDDGLPEGWNTGKIEDIVDRQRAGKLFSKKTVDIVGKVPVLDQSATGIIGFHNEEASIFASPSDRIITFANHTCVLRLVDFNFSAIQNVIPYKGKKYPTEWVLYASQNKQKFEEYKGHWPTFLVQSVILPDARTASVFANLVEPIVSKVFANTEENQTLAELRDTLLPKLMSGEIRVADAEREVEAAV